MNTLPTLNSKNFKQVKCPACEASPIRRGDSPYLPHLHFDGLRWNADTHQIELQGYCSKCCKEYRVLIEGMDGETMELTWLKDPKHTTNMGPVTEYLKRWG